MWLCFNDGFVSVVADKVDRDQLLVRARRRKDLVHALKGCSKLTTSKIIKTPPPADYLWRAFVSRHDFAEKVAAALEGIEYINFKGSVKDHDLHAMYMDFWSRHWRYQTTPAEPTTR